MLKVLKYLVEVKLELGVDVDFKMFPKEDFTPGVAATYLHLEDAKKLGLNKETIAINEGYLEKSDLKEIFGTLVHEMRHSFQRLHQNEPTEFGRKCKDNFVNYINNTDFKAYCLQFVELDATAYQELKLEKYYHCKLLLPDFLRKEINKYKGTI